jgi:hypothetical protein
MTLDQLADTIVANVKTGKWLSATFDVDGMPGVGVKAYGRWVQRIECCGVTTGVAAQKTNKALRAAVLDELAAIKRTIGC